MKTSTPSLHISQDRATNGLAAATLGAELLRNALGEKEEASIIVATGASQLEMLSALIQQPDIAWDRVTIFHLDEYIGLPATHAAAFRLYLWSRFHRHLPVPPRAFHYIAGDREPEAECARLAALIQDHNIDVCFAGIGENAHLAFNDPPADFANEKPYAIVNLDELCRRQQLGEGWFPTLNDVPRQAISMSIRQILRSRSLIITVPDERKAVAVKNSLCGPVTPNVPASILQTHPKVQVFLDSAAASLLEPSLSVA